jgi:hypothetical protein
VVADGVAVVIVGVVGVVVVVVSVVGVVVVVVSVVGVVVVVVSVVGVVVVVVRCGSGCQWRCRCRSDCAASRTRNSLSFSSCEGEATLGLSKVIEILSIRDFGTDPSLPKSYRNPQKSGLPNPVNTFCYIASRELRNLLSNCPIAHVWSSD